VVAPRAGAHVRLVPGQLGVVCDGGCSRYDAGIDDFPVGDRVSRDVGYVVCS
jgi:hypothetical protein